MPLREAYEFYGTPRGAVDNYTNGFAVQSLAYTTPFDAQEAAARIPGAVPSSIPSTLSLRPSREFYAAVRRPKRSCGWSRRVRSTSTTILASSTCRRRDRRVLRNHGQLITLRSPQGTV